MKKTETKPSIKYERDIKVIDMLLNIVETKASLLGCKSPNTKRDITLLN